WVANQHLRSADRGRLAELSLPYLQRAGGFPEEISPAHRVWAGNLLDLLKDSLSHLSQIPHTPAFRILLHFDPAAASSDPQSRADLQDETCRKVIAGFARLAASTSPLAPDSYRRVMGELGKETGLKGRALYHPIRLALTAQSQGPELIRLVPLIEEAAALS